MKVTILDLASKKYKTMDKRYADVLVKMKRAVYEDKVTNYQDKSMATKPEPRLPRETPEEIVEKQVDEVKDETEEDLDKDLVEEKPVKRLGRPPKKQKDE